MHTIIPAIIPKGGAHLKKTLRKLSFAPTIQIDVVDGVFATPASWPYQPKGTVANVAGAFKPFTIEVDLMVDDGIRAANAWLEVGVRTFIFHVEAKPDIAELHAFKHLHGCTIGCAITNNTPLEALEPYLYMCDFVQVMGIATIGAQAQPFDERTPFTIQHLCSKNPGLTITVDGSVNIETLPLLVHAGASRFVAGSAVTGADDPEAAYQALAELKVR